MRVMMGLLSVLTLSGNVGLGPCPGPAREDGE